MKGYSVGSNRPLKPAASKKIIFNHFNKSHVACCFSNLVFLPLQQSDMMVVRQEIDKRHEPG